MDYPTEEEIYQLIKESYPTTHSCIEISEFKERVSAIKGGVI